MKPKLVGINHVALEVGNVEEALEFYGRIFELSLRGRSGRMAFVDIGDQFLALAEGRRQAPDDHRHFGLVVDDKQGALDAARAAGAEVNGNRIRDPWGNNVEVVGVRGRPVHEGAGDPPTAWASTGSRRASRPARSCAPRALAELRPYRHDDVEALMPLFRELWSEEVITPPGLAYWLEEQPERAAMQAWVAEEDGELVAFANARFRWALAEPGIAGLWVGVLPEYRRRGLATSLYELAEGHLLNRAARQLGSTVREDEEEGRAFAKRRGYRETRREQYWALDVDQDAEPPSPPDNVQVVRLAEVLDRERDLFELYEIAERDMPDDHVHTMEFEDWKRDTLENPELDAELSAVVLVGDRPASFAWLVSDRDGQRAMNEMTGTAPEFRRRGFARLAKQTTLRWAAEVGIQRILTSNDSTNADMLALNDHLGYRAAVVRIVVVKDL